MKQILRFTIFLFIFLLSFTFAHSQCAIVVNNTFAASYSDNGNGTCTWTITFDITNNSGSGNSGFKYGLVADDQGNGTMTTINPDDATCDEMNVQAPGRTVTNMYTGSCDVYFNMEWIGFASPQCNGSSCQTGSETTVPAAPVELALFSGFPKGGLVELNWSTESEINNQYFEIQRSEDGRSFENIGMVEGQGTIETTSEYKFVDKYALPFAYYRLKQVDYDGKFEFSHIINVKRGDFQSKLMAYPTEAFNEITLRLETLDSRKSYLKIVNASGQLMYDETYYSTADTEYLNLDVQNYPPGIYFVSLSNKVETVTTKFIVVTD